MMGSKYPDHVRFAAIRDYYSGDDSAAVVAARHGIARSTFNGWVGKRDDAIGLTGGRWVIDQRRRVLVWERA